MVNKSLTAFILTENSDIARNNIEKLNAYNVVQDSYLVISESNVSPIPIYKIIKTNFAWTHHFEAL